MQDNHKQEINTLVGLVYDAALDPRRWPEVFDGVLRLIDDGPSGMDQALFAQGTETGPIAEFVDRHWDAGGNASPASSEDIFLPQEVEVVALLYPHVCRALAIDRKLTEADSVRSGAESLLDNLPIGVATLKSSGEMLSANTIARQLLATGQGVVLSGNHLCAVDKADQCRLMEVIVSVAAGDSGHPAGRALRLRRQGSSLPLSVLVVPAASLNRDTAAETVVLYIAAPDSPAEIPASRLCQLYDLTAAEARLLAALVGGLPLDSIADRFGVSKHTIRAQLKAVYAKTRTRRQSELVRKVLTEPAIFAVQNNNAVVGNNYFSPAEVAADRRHRRLRLRDGRWLGYAEYGAENGVPVLYMHSVTGSRLELPPIDEALAAKGVRVIVPERPGYGLSDGDREHSFLRWAEDIEDLLQYLGLEEAGLAGWSAGGVYAMALARYRPSLFNRAVLISSLCPFDRARDLAGMQPAYRMVLLVSRYSPRLAVPLIQYMIKGIRQNAELYLSRICQHSPEHDRKVLSDPVIHATCVQSMEEAIRGDGRSIMQSLLLLTQPWDMCPEEIQIPIEFWHGDEDGNVPLAMMQRLAERIPGAVLNIQPGSGHFFILEKAVELLARASGRTASQDLVANTGSGSNGAEYFLNR